MRMFACVCVSKVEARYRGRWDWFKAVVTAVRPSGYEIRYGDGESESNVHRALLRQVWRFVEEGGCAQII